MFYIIGLGLRDEKDVTIRGLEVKYPVYSDWRISYHFVGHQRIFSCILGSIH